MCGDPFLVGSCCRARELGRQEATRASRAQIVCDDC